MNHCLEQIKIQILEWVKNYNQPPAWNKVAKQFQLSKANTKNSLMILLRNHIKKWYEKEIYSKPEVSLNGVRIKNETKYKKKLTKKEKIFSLEREKEKVLNYVSNPIKKQQPPDNWSHLYHRFGYYRYTKQAYQPIKQWYNKLYPKLMDKFLKTVKNTKPKTLFDIASFNEEKKNFKTLLIKVFEYYKTTVEETFFNNFEHNQYFNDFFNIFIPQLSCCVQLDNSLSYLKPYYQVNDLVSFKEYLKNTPGLYSKMALWALDNPFRYPSSMISHQHHLMPVFLYKNTKSNYNFNKKQIEQSYNKVQVAVVVHILLHLIRLIEYNQIEDYQALTVTAGMGKSRNFLAFRDFMNPISSFTQVMNELLKNHLNLNTSQNVLSPHVIKILTKDTEWRHCQGFINKDGRLTSFTFSHKAQDPQKLTLNSLAQKLIETERKRIQITGGFTTVPFDNPKRVYDCIAEYLRGGCDKTKKALVVYNYYLVNAEDPVSKWPELSPFSSYFGPAISPFTSISESRFIIKHRNPIVPDIVGKPGDFQNIQDISNFCVERQFQYLGLELSLNKFYKLTTYFKYRLFKCSPKTEKHNFNCDLVLIRLPIV